jgi:hypothetical protein
MTRQTVTQQIPTNSPLSKSGILQRKCETCGQHTIASEECQGCKNKGLNLQRWAASQTELVEVPQIVHEVLNSPGQPLDSHTRGFMESRFSHDFNQVRVHTDSKAAESARTVNALAYTTNHNIVFAAGQYKPQTNHGNKLLVHELTHVIQQEKYPQRLQAKLAIAEIKSSAEQEADAAATAISQGLHFRVKSHELPQVARKPEEATDIFTKNDPVILIRIEPAEDKVIFYTVSGNTYEGKIKTDLAPGNYELVPQVKSQKWAIVDLVKLGLRFDVDLDDADPWKLAYAKRVRLEVGASAPQSPTFDMTVDERIAKISVLIQKTWTGDTEEKEIIRLLSETPLEQAEELLKKLTEQQIDGKSYLNALDKVVDGDNNLKLHEALSQLRLKVMGVEKGTAAIANAPVLPWHDVMGFFEDTATFSVSQTPTGKIKIEYHGGTRLLNSKDFGSEIKKLPLNLFLGGQEFDPNQVLIIHDYDNSRFVPVVAQQLVGYQHAGIRKFLGDIGTVASLAMPVSAARTVVGKAAVLTLERILPATLLLIDENRLNLVKWFPKWGPRMLHYADIVKTGIAIYGIARFAVSGYQVFQNWKAVRQARAKWESATSTAEAEKVALALEQQADDIISEAEKIYANEKSATGTASKAADEAKAMSTTPQAVADEASAVTQPKVSGNTKGQPTTPKLAEETVLGTKSSTSTAKANVFEGITDETRAMLERKPELKQLLEANPRAAKALKLCRSTCFPEFATKEQIARLEKLLDEAAKYDLPLNEAKLKEFLHQQKNVDDLDRAIGLLETQLSDKAMQLGSPKTAQVKAEFEEAGSKVADPTIPELPPTTAQLRGQPGEAIGGEKLKPITGKWFPDGRVGLFPGQIAKKMKGIHFKNFAEFREMFWMLVSKDPHLNQGWIPENLRRMARGQPPFASNAERVGGGSNRVYQLNHKQAIKNAGGVYDMDNIEIVTPLFHQHIGD